MQEFLYRIAESPAVQRLPHGKNLRRPDSYSIQDFLISKDFIPCSVRHHPAPAEHYDPLRPLTDQLHIMGSNHHRFGDILYVRQRPHDFLAGGDIQVGSRLVQQQNARIQGNADGETCPAHLAAGEKPAIPVLQFRQPEAGQQFVGARLPVFNVPYLHGIGDIGTNGILDKHLLRF